MKIRIRRILKWFLIVVALLLAVPVVVLLYAWGSYRAVVNAKPGSLQTSYKADKLCAEVDPFIATGGWPWMCGHDTPAATTPFGMVRLAPDTASLFFNTQCQNRSGYFYGDDKIIGFSHTRLVGADAEEGGVFRIFPTTQEVTTNNPLQPRFAKFSHTEEKAFPGYYAVRLPTDDILVELTATPRVGVHLYTFPSNAIPRLLIDVTSTLGNKRTENGFVQIYPETRSLEGSVRIFGSFSGRYDGLDVYFAAQLSESFKSFGIWNGKTYQDGEATAQGKRVGAILKFQSVSGEHPIEVRLALSYVSRADARNNLNAEVKDEAFNDIVTLAKNSWERRLSAMEIEGGTERQRRIFYSSLYHTFLMPTTFNDVNGDYVGFDRATHQAKDFMYYTDFSLWDTFRTVQPLYNLIARNDERDMMRSLVEMAKAGGCLPRWPSGCGYTNCMFGTPADVAVSEAYLKGIRDFDIDAAYATMRQNALVGKPANTKFAGREGLADYLKYGYCPSDTMSEAVSRNLEYAWCDTALASLAKELGKTDDAAILAKHGQSYRELWDKDRLFFVPKDTQGNFMKDFDPLALTYTDSKHKYTDDFVEGSPMQWRWSAAFDMEGLVSLFPNKEKFVSELEAYFEKSNKRLGNWHPGSYYWHGNEPYIHDAYLFNAAGRPDLTQKWVRRILETKYSDDYVGLDGNDDGGTLSAWYVFSALGFYPIAGTTRYELGAPLFPKAVIDLGDNHKLTVIADNYAPENLYVSAVALNGHAIAGTSFTHADIQNGGELRFTMSREPHH